MKKLSKFLPGIKPGTIAAALGLSVAIFGATPSQATPIIGGKIFVQHTGDVIATFVGSDAAFDNLLLLASPPNSDGVIFEGHVTPNGTVLNLGMFTAGTELILELSNQVGGIFFSGPANRNPDNIAHAIVNYDFAPGQIFIGFEDMLGGGDLDYNDLEFTLSNAGRSSVPDGGAPTAMLLGGSVFALLFLLRFAHR
jgi:uncharacterized protein DUF4114